MRALLGEALGVLLLVAAPALPADLSPQDTTPDRHVSTPFTKRPELKDRTKAQRILERHYPDELIDAGIGGTVGVLVLVGSDGRVKKTELHESSGNSTLDVAAIAAVREFEFSPAQNEDVVVQAWVEMPVVFRVRPYSQRQSTERELKPADPLQVARGFVLLLIPVLALLNAGLWYVLGFELKKNHPEVWRQLVPASQKGRLRFLWSGAYLRLGNRRVTRIGRSLKIVFPLFVALFSVLLLSLFFPSRVPESEVRLLPRAASKRDFITEYWWAILGSLLALFWSVRLATRRLKCPRCGEEFKGLGTSCPSCGVDIAHPTVRRKQRDARIMLVALVLMFLYVLYVYFIKG